MDERRVQMRFIISSFFACFRQSQYWRIFVLVLVFTEHPSGMSAGLSKTLEMFLGLPAILFNSIRVGCGFSRRTDNVRSHTGCLAPVGHSDWSEKGIGRLYSKRALEDRVARWHYPSIPVRMTIMAPYRVGCIQLFILQRGASCSIFHTPHSHAERRWHVWQSIIASLFLLSKEVASLFLISHVFLVFFESSTFETDIKQQRLVTPFP